MTDKYQLYDRVISFFNGFTSGKILMKLIFTASIFYLMILIQPNQAVADIFSQGEMAMNKAEKLYPGQFSSHQITQKAEPYLYRFYPSTGIYVRVNQNTLGVYLSGGGFGASLKYIGQLNELAALLNKTEKTHKKSSFTTFSFLTKNNPQLSQDIQLNIAGNTIKGSVPFDVSLDNLVATFTFNGVDVKMGGVHQDSAITHNNYQQILPYHVISADGVVNSYAVDVVRFTGLPMVFMTTADGTGIVSKEKYKQGSLKIVGNREFKGLDMAMKIRGRGNSTWAFADKKSFQMKLKRKTEVLGMPADKKWLFLAEYFDKTMIRNKTAFELGKLSHLDWTPSSVYAEVFINDQHKGTYHITQKVEESAHRVNIGKNGFLLEIDQLRRLDDDDIYFNSRHSIMVIKEPKVKKNDVQYQYISNYIKTFESTLYGENFKDPSQGYAKYIDVDSFVDWYLINEIVKNADAQNFSSIYMNVIPGKKLKMGPLWDFDLAFGNINYNNEPKSPIGFWVKDNQWISRLFEDPAFVEKVKTRFAYYRSKETFIQSMIDQYAAQLERSQYANDQIWHTIGIPLWPNPVWFNSYALEVEYMKNWLSQRMNWLDKVANEG